MSRKLDEALRAGAEQSRPRAQLQKDVKATGFGRMSEETTAPVPLPIAALCKSRYQTDVKTSAEYMENLVASIRAEGLHNPIIVRPTTRPEGSEKCDLITDFYEIVAGHHRVEAYRILGFEEIPAVIRYLSDTEAACALTSENTTRRKLGAWELYKHMAMLQREGALRFKTDLARVLNVHRTVVPVLEGFEDLPQAAKDLLDDHPDLVGYNLMKAIRPYCKENPNIVFDALVRLSAKKGDDPEEKVNESSIVGWIERQLNPGVRAERKEFNLPGGARISISKDGARVSGNVDYDRLHKLIVENMHLLAKDPSQAS